MSSLAPPPADTRISPRTSPAAKRRVAVLAAVAAVVLASTAIGAWQGDRAEALGRTRSLPVAGSIEVIAGFDPPSVRWGAGHRGVDLAAPPGTPVRSIAPGQVMFIGHVGGKPVVSVHHPESATPRLRSTYEPVVAAGHLAVGSWLDAGDVLGTVAEAGGHCVRSCLHLGLRTQDEYFDPLAWILMHLVVLKPV